MPSPIGWYQMSLRSIFCGRENEASAENAVRYRSDASKIRIKVFQGGLVSVQTGPFTSALIRSRNYFDSTGSTFPTIEFLNCEMARQRKKLDNKGNRRLGAGFGHPHIYESSPSR
jgi:hypothetical protein